MIKDKRWNYYSDNVLIRIYYLLIKTYKKYLQVKQKRFDSFLKRHNEHIKSIKVCAPSSLEKDTEGKKTPTISINIDMVFQKCQTFTKQNKEYKTRKYKNKPKTSVIWNKDTEFFNKSK